MIGRTQLVKLRAMAPREIAHRLLYEAQTVIERRNHKRQQGLSATDRLRRALLPEIARETRWQDALASMIPSTRFFAGIDSIQNLRELFQGRYLEELQKARTIAEEVSRNEIAFFGRRFSFGPEIDWHADPITRARWPQLYHRNVPVHGGNVGFGDVKYVWEINRHQFFVDLAKVAFLDRSSAHAAHLHRLLRDWMAKVPRATGAPWACALEPAFRAWSWLWAYRLVRAAGMVGADDDILWLTGFEDHGHFLYRHLEEYSSPYNHLIGEASALFALGTLFPCFRQASRWVARGRRVLESTLDSQFHGDGGSVEQSTFYHHATLGFYILAAVIGRRNDVELSPNVWAAIERGIQFSALLVEPGGRVPRIGGADDGKPIRMEHLRLWDFRPYQAVGAALFGRRDFKFVAERFWEDALWILGPEGMDTFDRLESLEPPRSVALSKSGYYVVRTGWSDEADYLCFDCGPQAAGLRRDEVPSAAHGHADCLSVVVALGGREVLVDPGFFCYNGDPRWEVDFRRTAAHNTISVDGHDQAQHVSKMAWTRTFSARPEAWSPELGWVQGSHDGYRRIADGLTHRRTVWLRPNGYVVIRDELTGSQGHDARAVFQFARGRLSLHDSWVLYEDRYEIAWVCSAPVCASVACGGGTPLDGWIAPSLGVREAAPRLELAISPRDDKLVVLLTVVADRVAVSPAAQRINTALPTESEPLRAIVAGKNFSDHVSASVQATMPASTIATHAPLVIVRKQERRVIDTLEAGVANIKGRAVSPDGCDV